MNTSSSSRRSEQGLGISSYPSEEVTILEDANSISLNRRHTINGKPALSVRTNALNPLNDRNDRNKHELERKRRSLNLSISYSHPCSENEGLISPTSDTASSRSGSKSPLTPRSTNKTEDLFSIRSRSRTPDIDLKSQISMPPPSRGKGTTASVARPRSFHLALEQEKLLQEQLQRLARTENARLTDGNNPLTASITPSLISTPSHNPHSVSMDTSNASFPSPPTLASAFSPTSLLESATGILSPPDEHSKRLHSRHQSLDVRSSVNSKKSRKKNRKSTSSFGSYSRTLLSTNFKDANDSKFFVTPQDLQMPHSNPLSPSPISSNSYTTATTATAIPLTIPTAGPTRPGNIEGTTLSWKMTSDLVAISAKSVVSTTDIMEVAAFVWSMFSRPENIGAVFNSNESRSLLPPTEVVKALRQRLPTLLQLKSLAIKIACASFSASVLFFQVSLLILMVIAYVIGDAITVPGKYCLKVISDSQTKKKLMKYNRKPRKIIPATKQ